MLRANGYDAIILQRELISTLATIESLLPGPRILDVDDAIFLHRDGSAARKIASGCLLVVCGNEYLAESFSQWNKNIAIIPTGVDTSRLRPAETSGGDDELIIGWIGTAGNFKYLEQMNSALTDVLGRHKDVTFRIVSSECPDFLGDLGDQVEFVQWYPGIEETLIPTFSIGIMPLSDSGWSRGKCAFKMLQYMAAGIPVVTSKVGMNAQLLSQDEIGIGVLTSDQWVEALEFLISDPACRHRMGANGRNLAVAQYSLPKIADLWKQQFDQVL
jgi:glycosyltransferase involved in cell wall biosynthesis